MYTYASLSLFNVHLMIQFIYIWYHKRIYSLMIYYKCVSLYRIQNGPNCEKSIMNLALM